MRNLKRVLSLALATVMLLGMMVIGAGAADAKKEAVKASDLTDMATVVNKEAVTLMVDLGIIQGKPDKTFAPTEVVDRATMAKLVYYIMMGDTDETAFKGVTTPLKDVKGNWAEGFINYCYSVKIVAGNGDGAFDPSGKVTVASAAKMLLVALGYDSAASKYEGDAMWSVNIMRDAQKAGLLKGIDQKSTEEMTRDNAAKMIYNALFAKTVTPDFEMDMGIKYLKGYKTVFQADGTTPLTLATSNYNLVKHTGVVVANDFGSVLGSTQDAGKTLIYTEYLASGKLTATNSKTMKIATGVALLGQEVVYYTHGTKNVDTSAITATGKTKTYTYNDSDITYAKFKSNNNLDDAVTECVSNYSPISAFTPAASDAATFVDSNADGKVDFTMKTTYFFSRVTKVDATNVTITGLGTRKIADVSGSADLKKDDYVSYTTVGNSGKAAVEKAKEVSGTMTAKKGDNTSNFATAKLVVDGTAYAVAAPATVKIAATAPARLATEYFDSQSISKAVAGIFYLDHAGKVAAYLPTEATTDTTVLYAYVTALNKTESFGTVTVEAKVVLADGTQQTLKVVDNDSTLANDSGLYDTTVKTASPFDALLGVYKYTLNKDGNMVAGVLVASTLTDGKYVAGNPTMVTDAGTALLDANTTVVFYNKPAGKAAQISSFKGVENVPGVADNAIVTVVAPAAGKSFTPYILVNAVGDVATAEYAYALGNTHASQSANGYDYDMVVKGAKVTLTTAAAVADMRIGMVYTYGLDKDNVATLSAVTDANMAIGDVKSVSAKYIVIGTTAIELASQYSVDDLTATDNKGAIVPGTGDLAAGTKIVYVLSAGKLVKAYIINNGSVALQANTNTTTTLSTDGYNVTVAGKLTDATDKLLLKFKAPAGVSAKSASAVTVKTYTDIAGTAGEAVPTFTAVTPGDKSTSFELDPIITSGVKCVKVVIVWNADLTETYTINIDGLALHA